MHKSPQIPNSESHITSAYGRGRHKAALNFGDRFAYAAAVTANDALLFVGDDFAQTDVTPA